MKTITILLSKNQSTIIDEEDFPLICDYKWFAVKGKKDSTFYAVSNIKKDNGKYYQGRMHRIIMRVGKQQQIDHVDNNGLNNTKGNLRLCTPSQNCYNRKKKNNSKYSKYKGVTFHNPTNKWRANISINKIWKHIGLYSTENEAALAYNIEAIKAHKEFAHINIITI